MRLALLFVFIITLSIWQISAFKLDEFSYSAALSLDFQVQHSMIDFKKIISLSSWNLRNGPWWTCLYFYERCFVLFQHFLSSDWPVHGFLYTLYAVMMCDVIIKHITAGLKLVVALSPFELLAAARKRRAYQLIEYASQVILFKFCLCLKRNFISDLSRCCAFSCLDSLFR